MPTLDEIKKQVGSMSGAEKLIAFKEIKELPKILWHDENLEHIIRGTYDNGAGILAATNKRLVFVDKGLIFGLRVEDFPYDKITSIQYETGLIMGEITIFSSGNKAVIKHLDKSRTRIFAEFVRARITNQSKNVSVQNTDNKNDDFISKIERLSKLKEDGVLTEEEFLEQKKLVLSQI